METGLGTLTSWLMSGNKSEFMVLFLRSDTSGLILYGNICVVQNTYQISSLSDTFEGWC
jgi:hypothetical protein